MIDARAQHLADVRAGSADERHALANSLLVEYTNTFDYWYGHGPTASTHGGLLTDVDAMLTMTQLNYSVPGSWNDADMLQIWSATQPSFLLWDTVHAPPSRADCCCRLPLPPACLARA